MVSDRGIREPVSRALQRVLRIAVLDHVNHERRRGGYPPVLHVGFPGHDALTLDIAADEALDHALRTDIVQAMARDHLEQQRVPLVWLTRHPDTHDVEDQLWAAATQSAGAELGVNLLLVVVTRRWWRDPRTGVGRGWKRLRPNPSESSDHSASPSDQSKPPAQTSGGTASWRIAER